MSHKCNDTMATCTIATKDCQSLHYVTYAMDNTKLKPTVTYHSATCFKELLMEYLKLCFGLGI